MMRVALEAFVKAYGSQDSFTEGLDKAFGLAKAALAATPAVGGEAILARCDDLHDLGFNAGWNGAIEECVKLVEGTALKNPTNIARDIRALAQPASPLRGRDDARESVISAFEHLRKKMRGNTSGEELAAFARLDKAVRELSASPPEQPAAG